MSPRPSGSACADREASLQALLFSELPEKEREAVEHHLSVCARCHQAFQDAKAGLDALSSLATAPLPFGEDEAQDASPETPVMPSIDDEWAVFRRRLGARQRLEVTARSGVWFSAARAGAAAALLLVGFATGRWVAMERSPSESGVEAPTPVAEADGLTVPRVESEAVEALARAELLSDVGLGYVSGLLDLHTEVTRISLGGGSSFGDLAITRERARELIRDGRLLRRRLDPEADRAFLAAIDRAEICLEELAVLDVDATGASARIVQAAWAGSELPRALSEVDVEAKLARALEASGWIGEELVERKEF